MRIRRNASKPICDTAATSALASPPCEEAQSVVAAVLQEPYVCLLNQSPWDVCPSLPPSPSDDRLHTSSPEKKQEEVVMTNEIDVLEPSSAMTSISDQNSKSPFVGGTAASKTNKRRRTDGSSNKLAADVPICKKHDGKRWRCSEPAHYPHALCHRHLAQRSSCDVAGESSAGGGGGSCGVKRKRREVKPTGGFHSFAADYYYDSAFGPWRGKDRSRTPTARGGHEANVGGSEDGDSHVHAEKGTEDAVQKKDGQQVRKPVKERSLRSMM